MEQRRRNAGTGQIYKDGWAEQSPGNKIGERDSWIQLSGLSNVTWSQPRIMGVHKDGGAVALWEQSSIHACPYTYTVHSQSKINCLHRNMTARLVWGGGSPLHTFLLWNSTSPVYMIQSGGLFKIPCTLSSIHLGADAQYIQILFFWNILDTSQKKINSLRATSKKKN